MRYALALAAVIVVGVTAKVFFIPSVAEATLKNSATLDVSKMHTNVAMPEQDMHDMSFIYTDRK